MTLFFKKYNHHIFLVAIGIAWLLILYVLLDVQAQTLLFPDATNYHESAMQLYGHFQVHHYRPMLMAFVYGFPLLFGVSETQLYTISISMNCLFWLSTILILFELVKNYCSIKIAFLLSVFFIFFVGNALMNFNFLAESFFLFTLVLSFYFLQKYSHAKIFKWLVLALSLMVLSMLIKPATKFFALFMLLYFGKTLFKNYQRKSIFLLYGSIALCLIQAGAIKKQFGDFTISYIDSVTFYNYLFSKADFYRKGIEFDQSNNPRADFLFNQTVHNQKRIANEDIKEQLLNNKMNLTKAYWHNFTWNTASGNMFPFNYTNVMKSKSFEQSQAVFFWISKYQNRIMTIVGILLGLFSLWYFYKKESTAFLAALFILYILGISGISSDQGDRFHLITYPFTLILIATVIKTKLFAARLQK